VPLVITVQCDKVTWQKRVQQWRFFPLMLNDPTRHAGRENATDRHGRAHKVFSAHGRA
jgi:hypothetical protein